VSGRADTLSPGSVRRGGHLVSGGVDRSAMLTYRFFPQLNQIVVAMCPLYRTYKRGKPSFSSRQPSAYSASVSKGHSKGHVSPGFGASAATGTARQTVAQGRTPARLELPLVTYSTSDASYARLSRR
jgi:hypothetical protein